MRRISYSETERVEIEGASFDLCPIPAHKWTEIRLRSRRALQRAKRAGLLALQAAGVEAPTEAQVFEEAWLDPAYRVEYEASIREAVAWGVRGHSLTDPSGQPIPFEQVEREFVGRRYAGASEATVGLYSEFRLDGADGTLLEALYVRVSEKNSVSAEQKKSSPPPSESPPGGGPATTA